MLIFIIICNPYYKIFNSVSDGQSIIEGTKMNLK
jgi:hypothetical protein